MKIVGYADHLSAAPGQTVQLMVSADAPSYTADLVRLIHGDTNPAGPGIRLEEIPSTLAGEYPGKPQPIRPGSYAHGSFREPLDTSAGITALMWIYPTTPVDAPQTLMAVMSRGVPWLRLHLVEGRVRAQVGGEGGATLTAEVVLQPRRWYRIAISHDVAADAATLYVHSTRPNPRRYIARSEVRVATSPTVDGLTLAARPISEARHNEHYNGKIGAPSIYSRVLSPSEVDSLDNRLGLGTPAGPALAWDFSHDIDGQKVTDRSGKTRDGATVQRPTRGVTGHDWDGVETCWRHARSQYDAIHFHDDDLDDAGWTPDIVWQIPEHLPSAVYAVRLRAEDEEDFIPLVVRPKPGSATARVALLLPTFSYLAYADEQVMNSKERREALERLADDMPGYPVQPQDRYIVANRLLSLYDKHRDGSGVCYSSRLRPIVDMRPAYNLPWMHDGKGAPHGLNADLHLVDWLHELGYTVDVITDEDLHHEGEALLQHYAVVLTGSHPEYCSRQMIDATRGYIDGGGRLMYLGGNGWYWVTGLDEEAGHTIEIRRRGPATRVWEPASGEAHLSVNGELGGIWRFRGRAPQSWLGVGFTAQGLGPGRPYRRQAAGHDPAVAFVFAGLDSDEEIGDFPALVNGYGAAGYELDRADPLLGTGHNAVVLASATGFSDSFQAVAEEIFEADSAQGGTVNPNVRSDMALVTHESGGAVFSVGSITWASCLSYNGYDNSVSRVTRNVLDRFLQPERFEGPT
jgi:N,N-dimethylformamidase